MSRSLRPRRSAASRAGSWLVNIVMIVATVAGVGYLAPSLFGFERYVITGGSMSGTFEKGSIAFEQRVPVEDVKVGDVITYLPPADSGTNHLVTHRVISDTILPTDAALPVNHQRAFRGHVAGFRAAHLIEGFGLFAVVDVPDGHHGHMQHVMLAQPLKAL